MNATAEHIEAEYVVIGGGSGGAVVAGRLAERGRDVLLIEAGPDYGPFGDPRWPSELVDARMLATSHDWQYADDRWTWSRARVIGGCSSHNGAIAAVGHRVDYDGWNLPGWSAADVAPIFAEVVERMRVRAYAPADAVPYHRQCLAAAAALGWNVASDLCDLDANESFGLETVNVFGTNRWNTAFAYLDPVRDRVRVCDCTVVDRLEQVADGVLVRGVRVPMVPHSPTAAFPPSHRGEPVTIAAGTVVLAAGVYGSPAILQRSGVGAADRLRSAGIMPIVDSPNVGANLHDHPMVNTGRIIGAELQAELDAAAATGFLPEEQTLGKFCSSLATDGIYDTHLFPVMASNQTSVFHGKAFVEVACVKPRSRGRVDVVSGDPLAQPSIDHAYLSDPDDHDLTVLRDGLQTAETLLDHPIVASLLGGPLYDSLADEAIRQRVAHYYHPVGTCAMGLGADAVCGPDGRVNGVPNVLVADASLIPEIPRANTNLPAIMIGERIARLLG